MTATRCFNRPSGLEADQALHLAVWANQNLSAAFFNKIECELRVGDNLRSLFRSPELPEHSLSGGLNVELERLSFSCFSLSQELWRAYNSVNLVYRIAATEPLWLGQAVLGIQDRAKS